jgi:hypothetical protein
MRIIRHFDLFRFGDHIEAALPEPHVKENEQANDQKDPVHAG